MEENNERALVRLRICLWCETQYGTAASRARDNAIFCSRRCEAEARYWLFSVLNGSPEAD